MYISGTVFAIYNVENKSRRTKMKKFVFELEEIISIRELFRRIKFAYIKHVWSELKTKNISELARTLKTKNRTLFYKNSPLK